MTEAPGQSATNLLHDLCALLVIELQLGNGLVDAHPSDLWATTEKKKRDNCCCVVFVQVFKLGGNTLQRI